MEFKEIFDILKNQQQIEFEVRFGYFTKNKSFISGIKESVFESLRNSYEYQNHKFQIIETKSYEKFPGTMIETLMESAWKYRNLRKVKKVFIKTKQKIKNIDDHKLNVRFALNTETYEYPELKENVMKILEKETPSFIRYKERHVIPLDDSFELHLTKTIQNEQLNFECEIEFKGTLSDEKYIENSIKKYIEKINKIIRISHVFKKVLQSIFNKFPNNLNQVLNKPFTLNRKYLPNIAMNYTVTDKADGERNLLFIDKFGSGYLVDNKFTLKNIGNFPTYKNSIFDGEYILSNNQFMIFDCIQYKNMKIIDKKLLTRLMWINQFVKDIKNKIIKSKVFYVDLKYLDPNDRVMIKKLDNVKIPKDYTSFLKMLWNKRRDRFSYSLDGLIFTPVDATYLDPKKGIYKWKDEHTIDVRVMYDNKDKVWKLDVNRFDNKPDYLDITYKPRKDDTMELLNGEIVEFLYSYKQKTWVPYRKRTDKELPNARLTVEGVLNAVEENIKIDDLVNIDLKNFGQMYYQESNETLQKRKYAIDYPMRKFHNHVKNQLIQYRNKNQKTLLDLAVGKGGDLNKWKNAGYKVILGIDVSKKSLDEFKKRTSDVKGMDIYMVHGDSTKDIRSGACAYDDEGKNTLKAFFKKYPNIKFDKIVCNFAIHYMFMDDKDRKGKERVSTFFTNIKKLLSDEGNFVGTILSGNQLEKKLLNQKEIVGVKNKKEFYKIKKVEPFYKKPEQKLSYSQVFNSKFYNNQIIVSREGWEQEIPENIVYESVLSLIGKFHGLQLVGKYDRFETYYDPSFKLSSNEKKISFLHKTFVFRKVDELIMAAKHYNLKYTNREDICKQLKEIIKQQK
jgi:hypothetical protein